MIATRTTCLFVAALAVAAILPGCDSRGVSYGRVHGKGLNGTSALAEMVRGREHSVRVAVRLNEDVGANADTIVRFAPYSGPPDAREAGWYAKWLAEKPGRRLLYVVRDYDATADYWSEILKTLPKDDKHRPRAEKLRDEAKADDAWSSPADKPLANAPTWFLTEEAKTGQEGELGGEWSENLDAKAAALPVRERIILPQVGFWDIALSEGENILVLKGNSSAEAGEMLVVANGSFLLNGGLLNRARRPLAARVVDWIGLGGHRVVFVEGRKPRVEPGEKVTPPPRNEKRKGPPDPDDDDSSSPGLMVGSGGPLDLIVVQFLGFGLLVCLYLGTRLGRPRGEPPPGVGKPSAHAEALGDLLARVRNDEAARSLLDAYRRWRSPDRPQSP